MLSIFLITPSMLNPGRMNTLFFQSPSQISSPETPNIIPQNKIQTVPNHKPRNVSWVSSLPSCQLILHKSLPLAVALLLSASPGELIEFIPVFCDCICVNWLIFSPLFRVLQLKQDLCLDFLGWNQYLVPRFLKLIFLTGSMVWC